MSAPLSGHELSSEQIAAVKDALVKSFNLDRFTMMVRRRLGLRIADEVGVDSGFRKVVDDFVELAIEQAWVEQLVRAARAELPGAPESSRSLCSCKSIRTSRRPRQTTTRTGFRNSCASGRRP